MFRFSLFSLALVILAGCEASTGPSANTSMAKRINIASSAPKAYGNLPCTVWGLAAEKSMLGYQLEMHPVEVLRDLPGVLRAPENLRTLELVMSNVAKFDLVRGDAEKIYLAETYRSLVVEECTAVRAS